MPRETSGPSRRDVERRFTDEEWLTPMQIARRLGYATDKPVRNAIKRGELRASHAPCRRKLIVAESEVLRWIDEDLAYEPMISQPESRARADPPRNGHSRPSGRMPSLRYDPLEREQP
jgi:hypothetical protein